MSTTQPAGRSFRIAGGSQSDKAMAQGQGRIGFFQKGVNNIKPSGKHPLQGRILPARDPEMSPSDSAWAASVIPYRDMISGELDPDTQSPAFTGWYANVLGYRFFGRGSEDLLSPQTLKGLVGDSPISTEDAADPIQDIFNFAAESGNEDWVAMTKKPEKKNSRSPIPLASKLSLLNMYVKTSKAGWENAVVVVSRSALENLKLKLCWPTPRSIEPLDPKFPDYLYGDVTAPKTGLLTTITSIELENISVNGFVFATKDFTLDGAQRMALKDAEQNKILAARYDLTSSDTLKILTYQQIVDFLVDDGTIPYELIQQACGDCANVPPSKRQNTTVSAGTRTAGRPAREEVETEPEAEPVQQRPAKGGAATAPLRRNPVDEAEADQISGLGEEAPEAPEDEAPPAPEEDEAPPAPEEEAPAAPEPEPERIFWVSIDKAVTKKPESEIVAAIEAGCAVRVMALDREGGWQAPSAFGIEVGVTAEPVAAQAPAKPAPPKVAPKTATPKAATPKAAAKAEVPAGGVDEVPGLDETDRARYYELKARMNDADNPASGDEINEMVALMQKSAQQA